MPETKPHPLRTRLADIGMVIFGMIMAVTPLALWVAPTKPWFYLVLKLFAISSVAVWYLSGFETSAAQHHKNLMAARLKPSAFEKYFKNNRFLVSLRSHSKAKKQRAERAKKHRDDIRRSRDD